MAPPFRWSDGFVDAGWLSVLSHAALRLVLAIARRVDGIRQTRIGLGRLRNEADLPRSTFYRAKTELTDHGLLKRSKVNGKWTLTLIWPIPMPRSSAKPSSLIHKARRSQERDSSVSLMGPTGRRDARIDPNTATVQQKTKKQLGGKTQGQERTAVRDYLRQQGLSGKALNSFIAAVEDLRLEGGATLEAKAHRLSREMQAKGHMDWSEHRAREVLMNGVAAAHPVVQAAFEIFNCRLLDIVATTPAPDVPPERQRE